MIIVSRNLEMHIEQAQCNQVVKIKAIKHDLTKQEQSNSDHSEHQFIILQEKVNRISSFKRFCLFYPKKTTFSILHHHFYKTPTSVYYFTRYFNKIFILHQFFIIFPMVILFLI